MIGSDGARTAREVAETGARTPFWPAVAVTLALAIVFFVLHPHWYLDAVIYADDVARGALWFDAGHLIWRPLGAAIVVMLRVASPDVDPLVGLRIASSLGAGALCVLTYALGRRVELDAWTSVLAGGLVAASQAALALGGSGSSYLLAAAFGTASLACFVRPAGTWRTRDGLLGATMFAGAWALWGLYALLFAGVVVAAWIYDRGPGLWRPRVVVVTAVIGALIASSLAGVYALQPEDASFVEWLGRASHGIPAGVSAIGFARAGYGFLIGFAHLGDTGRELKAVLVGSDASIDPVGLLLPMVMVLTIAALGTLALLGWFKAARRKSARRWLIVFAVSALPVVGFAAIWQGSDLERFTPILAPTVVTALVGVRALSRRLVRWAPTVVLAGLALQNTLTFVVPRRFGSEALNYHLGRIAREHVVRHSLLVMTGQELWGALAASTRYFWELDAMSVHYIVSVYGVEEWRPQLCRKAAEALDSGGAVAVLSDLVGDGTPGGIGLVETEYPEPTLEEVGSFFEGWQRTDEWEAGRFRFYTLAPPPEGIRCAAQTVAVG